MAERKKDPLEHLKKPTKVKYPSMARKQKLAERKETSKSVSKARLKPKAK